MRWFVRIIIGIVILIALAALTVQVVLATDIPRRMVVSALNEQTGLDFSASSLRTGWGGVTELRDVTVSLPSERDPFVTIPSLRITHTDLIRLAVFRDIEIDEAAIEQPLVVLRQDAAGAWNVVRAAAIIEQVQGAREPAPAPRPLELPRLSVRDGRVDVERPEHVIRYDQINLEGRPATGVPRGLAMWAFEGRLADERIIGGHLSPRGHWPHRLDITIDEAAPLVGPWREELAAEAPDLPEVPANLGVAFSWEGEMTPAGDGVTGQLQVDRVIAGERIAHGAAAVTLAGPMISIEPSDLTIDIGQPDPLRLRSGQIVMRTDTQHLELSRVLVEAFETSAQIDAVWDGHRERGSGQVRWSGHLAALLADHEGLAQVNFSIPTVGRRMIDGTIHTQGTIPQGYWDGEISFAGFGRTWEELIGRTSARRLDFLTADQEYDLSGLAARFTRRDRDVLLTHLDLPTGGPAEAMALARSVASVNVDTLDWSVDLRAANWTPPARLAVDHVAAERPVSFTVRAHGSPKHANLETFILQTPDSKIRIAGEYDAVKPAPLDIRAVVDMKFPDEAQQLTGRLHADLIVTGTIEPMNLRLAGQASGSDLAWEDRAIEPVSVDLRGGVDAHRAEFETDAFALLGGTVQITGNFDRTTRDVRFALDSRETNIEQVMLIAGAPIEADDFAGAVSTTADVFIPGLDFSAIELTGAWTAHDLRGHFFRATTGEGNVRIHGDHVHLYEMMLEHDGGTLTGVADLDLRDLRRLVLDVTMAQWAMFAPAIDAAAYINGDAALTVDLIDMTAFGPLILQGEARLNGAELAQFELDASIDGRTLDVQSIVAVGLDGVGRGSGLIYLDPQHWTDTTLAFEWENVDLVLLEEIMGRRSEVSGPSLGASDGILNEPIAHRRALTSSFSGISSGSISLVRSDDRRAPEPMRIDLDVTIQDGRYGAIQFEHLIARAFLGRDRLMIDEARAATAGGHVDFWGRLTRHEGDPFVHLYVNIDPANGPGIELQQLVSFIELTDEPAPGRITGWGSAGGYLREPHRMFGQAHFNLRESDIAALPGISHLYSLLRVDFGRPEPTGYGEATVRLEGDALDIARLSYFNRGTDVVARLRIENIWQGGESPINGLTAGVVRPLRDLDLPLVGRADRLIGAIQTDTASVRLGGTLSDYTVDIVPFAEITGALSRILRGTVGR